MSEEKQQMFGVVALFGHKQIAGEISDYSLGGDSFVRVDVPDVNEIPAHTMLFGKGAIYSISFVGREVAEAVARNLQSKPITVYDFDKETRSRMAAVPAIGLSHQKSIHDEDDQDYFSDITQIG